MTFDAFLESIPDPDLVGQSEYRAVWETVQDCDSYELAMAACQELIEHSLSMMTRMEKAEEEEQ